MSFLSPLQRPQLGLYSMAVFTGIRRKQPLVTVRTIFLKDYSLHVLGKWFGSSSSSVVSELHRQMKGTLCVIIRCLESFGTFGIEEIK